MEFGGNGGFHGNSELRQPVSGIEAPESSMLGLLSDQMKQTINNNSSGDGNECTVREQDRFMPIANVVRIMRKILPPPAKISDEAKETMQECVSEFISFITGEANDRCQKEQRKTVTAEDLLFAMSNLGFDDYIEPLTRYLQHYRECDGGERGLSRGEPMMNRAADPVNYGTTDLVNYGTTGPINYGIPPFAPAFVAQPPGFFGPATMNINGPDPSGAGPFLVPKANLEPFRPSR